jgi:iron(III) transport system substrate-binding protein
MEPVTEALRERIRKPRVRRLGLLAAASLVAIALTGCGATSAPGASSGGATKGGDAVRQIESLPAGQQRDKAVEIAKKEGSLSLYTELQDQTSQAVANAFQQKYGITVNLYRASAETVEQRITQEAGANRLGGDAVVLGYGGMADLAAKKDLLQPFDGASAKSLKEPSDFSGWTAATGYLYLPVWNSKLIPNSDGPKSWEGLADPRFNGKMVIEESDSDWYGALTTYWKSQGKSQDDIDELWKDIVDGSVIGSGHSAIMQLLGAGQSGITAMNYDYIAEAQIDKGAPISYRDGDGSVGAHAFIYPVGVAPFRKAQHPAAAWLFTDWLLTDGQKLMGDQHLLSAKQVVGTEKIDGIQASIVPAEVISERSKWEDQFDQLIRGVPKAPSTGN